MQQDVSPILYQYCTPQMNTSFSTPIIYQEIFHNCGILSHPNIVLKSKRHQCTPEILQSFPRQPPTILYYSIPPNISDPLFITPDAGDAPRNLHPKESPKILQSRNVDHPSIPHIYQTLSIEKHPRIQNNPSPQPQTLHPKTLSYRY